MSNDTIFREVDEELRSDRMRALWKRFGPYIIGAAAAVVLLVAANEGWKWWQESSAARSSEQFYAALELAEAGDTAGAVAALEQVEAEGSGGYPTLARFREAAILARQGEVDEAVAAYDALATAADNAQLRDLALVLAGYLLVDSGEADAVRQRVGGIAAEGHPLRNAAREALGLAQYRGGDETAALTTFQTVLEDPVVSPELRNRIEIYSAQLIARGAGSASADAAPGSPAEDIEAPAVDAGAGG